MSMRKGYKEVKNKFKDRARQLLGGSPAQSTSSLPINASPGVGPTPTAPTSLAASITRPTSAPPESGQMVVGNSSLPDDPSPNTSEMPESLVLPAVSVTGLASAPPNVVYDSSLPDDPPPNSSPEPESLVIPAESIFQPVSAPPSGGQSFIDDSSPPNDSLPSISQMPESLALPVVSISPPVSTPLSSRQIVTDDSSLPDNSPPNIGCKPETFALQADSVSQTASAPASGDQRAVNKTWTCLEGFLQVLTKGSTVFGPLKMAMKDLAEGIAMYEEAAAARRDYEELKSELEALFGTLSAHFSGEVPPTMTASMDSFCSAIEKELDWISSKEERGTARRHWEAKQDIDEVMECYRRIQGHLDRLTLNADLSTWKIVNELATMDRLRSLQPSMSACYDSAEADQLRRRECTPETRKEVLAKLSTWTHSREQGNIYWLNGMAGTGKTTIATSLCTMLKRTHEIGASFFCTRQLPECRDVKRILPTIAYQLASFSRPFRWALSLALERDPDIATKALPIQLEGLIIGPLSKVAETLPTDLVVVIDALDECDDSSGVGQVLEVLVRRASELPIKVFVSSRPEPQIRETIGSMDSRLRLVLHELDDQVVKGDVETYLRAELATISVSEPQLSELVNRAGVLFIYAATVVRYIKTKSFRSGQQKRLDAVLSSPAGSPDNNKVIDTLYDFVLASAFSDSELDDSDKEHMHLVLWTVVCAQEPLTVDALAGVLQLGDTEWVRAALQPLWSVLHISGANGLVNTLHTSFPDYILNPQRSKEHSCDTKAHHGRLAELSFARIQSNKRQFNICELESSYVFDEQVPNLDDRVQQAVPLDLAYACEYWAVHLELGERSGERVRLLAEFLSMRLLLWMEVLNLRKRINIGPGLLSRARKWCMDGASDTKDLAHDAWRFVSTFAANPVSRSTPHIYVSMLTFWPKTRLISEQYIRRTSCLVNVTGTAMARRELNLLGTVTTEARVYSVAVSPDGMRIVSASDDSTIRVWDGQSGQMVLEPLKGHTFWVVSVEFSPDGMRIVSGSEDKTIRVWDAQSGQMVLGPLEGHTYSVKSVAFSPDGMRIVSGSEDKTIRVWDGQNGQMVLEPLEGHTDSVNSVAFSPDGMHIVSASEDNTIRVWDGQRGQMVLGPLKGHTHPVNSVVFSSDGMRIVSGSEDSTIRVWDGQSGQMVLGPLQGHTSWVNSVMFSPDGMHIVSGSSDKTIRVWDGQNGQMVLGPLEGHTYSVNSVTFSPDGMRIVSGSWDKTIRVWDGQSGQMMLGPLEGHTNAVYSVAFSPDGMRIVSGSEDKTIRVWDEQRGQMVLGPLKGHTHLVNSVAFSPDGMRIVSGSNDKTIRVWDGQSGQMVLGPLKGHTNLVNSVAFSPDGMCIVSGSSDKTIRVWDGQSGQMVLGPLHGHTLSVNSVTFLPDGMRIISSSSDDTIRVWDGQSGQMVLGPLKGHTNYVYSVAFSPDGMRIVSGSWDKTIRVWDGQNGHMVLGPLEGHTHSVYSVAFSPDGMRIVSGSEDKTIRVWDGQSGQMVLGPLEGHTDSVRSVAFSPDGIHIVSGSDDKTIRVWDGRSGQMVPFMGHPGIVSSAAPLANVSDQRWQAPYAPTPALPVCTTTPTLNPMSRFGTPSPWRLNDAGWAIDEHQRPLLWVPHDLRDRLLVPLNILSIHARGSVQLNFDHAQIGESWMECYKPA